VPKIISECYELVKLCDINCSGLVFLDTLYVTCVRDLYAATRLKLVTGWTDSFPRHKEIESHTVRCL